MGLLNELVVGNLVVEGKIVNQGDPNASSLAPTARNEVIIVGPIVSVAAATGSTNLVTIPAGLTVTSVVSQTIVASDATTHTVNIGDASDADGWDAAVNLKATAGTKVTGDGAYATAANIAATMGKTYSAATTLVGAETVSGTPTVGTYRVIVYGYFA